MSGKEKPPAASPQTEDVLRLLRRLCARGASGGVAIEAVAGGRIRLVSVGPGGANAEVAEAAWRSAVEARWVTCAPGGTLWRTSRQGLAHLRRCLSSLGEQPDARRCAAREPRASPAAPTRNPAESPLAWLASRKGRDGEALISQPEFDAGERLRADFWFAQLTPRTTSAWAVPTAGGAARRSAPGAGVEMRDDVLAARERVHRALGAVGPDLAGVLIDVCCHLKGLEDVERAARWPQRSGKIVLRLALAQLARHYGLLPREDVARAQVARIRHWGVDDYRPGLRHCD